LLSDKSINIRDPRQVVWAISSKVDPVRDVFILPNTPFDTLDFASEKIGLGGRMGIDATTKMPPETDHEWGKFWSPIRMWRRWSIGVGLSTVWRFEFGRSRSEFVWI
jgi:3-polyprenyl-4-hydroxybenzoate decarboxylase